MRRLAALALLAACAPPADPGGDDEAPPACDIGAGPRTDAAPPEALAGATRLLAGARVALPAGAELLPDDAARPGEAKPQAVLSAGGNIWVFLTNLAKNADGTYAPAGPGYASVQDPATLAAVDLVRLETGEGAGRRRCLNPGYAKVAGDRILVACAADFFSAAGALAEIDVAQRRVARITPVAGAPGSLLAAGPVVWMGDLAGGRLLGVEPETGVARESVEICPRGDAPFEMVGDVALVGGRAFATCFGHDEVVEFDPCTGRPFGRRHATGDGPIALGAAADRLFVVDNLGATLSLLSLPRPSSAQAAALALGRAPTGIDATPTLLAVTNSLDGTVTLLSAAGPTKLDSANLKAAGGGTPYPWGVAFGPGAVYATLNGPGELFRAGLAP